MNKQILAHGFTEDMVSITQLYCKQQGQENSIKAEAIEIIESIQPIFKQFGQRKNINESLGIWYFLKKKNATYFVLATPGYQERLAYLCLGVL
jgi:hypothetical protein